YTRKPIVPATPTCNKTPKNVSKETNRGTRRNAKKAEKIVRIPAIIAFLNVINPIEDGWKSLTILKDFSDPQLTIGAWSADPVNFIKYFIQFFANTVVLYLFYPFTLFPIIFILGPVISFFILWRQLKKSGNESFTDKLKLIQFEIEAGSTRPPKDEAVERKQWIDTAFGIKERFPNRVKDDVLLTQLFKKLGFKDIEEMIIKFDDIEIKAAQKENELLLQGNEQGNEQVVSPNENHMLHLQVHGQVAQVPGIPTTPQFNQHILDHAQFLEMSQPTIAGGTQQTPSPREVRRQGTPEGVDLAGGATNILKGTGANP
ncbi:hypothetical protein LCGC14_2543860, partial [marine sediment metagenome]